MRTVHKARLVPDTAPDGLTEKVILVRDLGVPIEIALGRFEIAPTGQLLDVMHALHDEVQSRGE